MIGSRIRRLRTKQGLTQRELAAPKYTHAYVSTIEAGRRVPSREALEYFARKLGVGADELLTGRPADLQPRLELALHETRIAISEGRFGEVDEELRRIAREAKRFDLPRIQAKALEIRGLWLERGGRAEDALSEYQRAEELLQAEPATARVDIVAAKARAFEMLGDVRYAIYLLESLLDQLHREDLTDPDAMVRIHAGLIYSYLDAGLLTKAAESAAELERLAPKIVDPARIGQMHINVARAYLTQGRVEDAEKSLLLAERSYRHASLLTESGGANLARGYVLSRDGRLVEARKELEKARAIFEETGDKKDLVRTLNELARVERVEGASETARGLLERAIELGQGGDTPILAWSHRELGLTLMQTESASAEKHLLVAIELYESSEQTVDLALTYGMLGDLTRARGDCDGSADAYRAGIGAFESQL